MYITLTHKESPSGDQRAMRNFSDESRFNLSINMSVLKFGLPTVNDSSQSACLKPRKTPPTPWSQCGGASVGVPLYVQG